ncbi:MAG: tetratricopeptide repeat protein [Nitrospinae bacterium]|nr:tetratricopeptide repeat protein [Nitrospinota bacterium]
MGRTTPWTFCILPFILLVLHGCMGAYRRAVDAEQAKERYARALQYLSLGAGEQAIRELTEAVKQDPTNAELYNALGLAYHFEGKFRLALTHYMQALQLAPGYAEAHVNRAALHLDLAQWDEAIAHGRDALKNSAYQNPEKAYNNIGLAYLGKGDLIAARRAFNDALAFRTNFPEAHRHLGTIFFQQGNVEAAIREFREALRLRPNYAEAYVDLGVAYLERGDKAEAIAQFQKVMQLDPESELAELSQWYLGTIR